MTDSLHHHRKPSSFRHVYLPIKLPSLGRHSHIPRIISRVKWNDRARIRCFSDPVLPSEAETFRAFGGVTADVVDEFERDRIGLGQAGVVRGWTDGL